MLAAADHERLLLVLAKHLDERRRLLACAANACPISLAASTWTSFRALAPRLSASEWTASEAEIRCVAASGCKDELVEAGAGHRFYPGHGRLMKEWVAPRPSDGTECAAYVSEARSFVVG